MWFPKPDWVCLTRGKLVGERDSGVRLQGVSALSAEGGSPENGAHGRTREVKEGKDKGKGGMSY